MTLPSRPDSVCLVHMTKESSGEGAQSGVSAGIAAPTALYLNVGLSTGVLVRVAVDPVAGSLSDSRQRFLGPKSVKLFRVSVHGTRGVLALSSRPWLLYNYQGRYFQTPISYESLEYAANFTSELCPEGIVAVTGNTLRIVTIDSLGTLFNQLSYPLRYTPRKMCVVPGTKCLAVIESDHNEFNEFEKDALTKSRKTDTLMDVDQPASVTPEEAGEDEEDDGVVIPLRGPMPPLDGKWASCIRIIEPATGETKELLELSNNEAAFSICTCRFAQQHSEETFIIAGIAKDLVLHPRTAKAYYIHVYRLLGDRLQLLHETEVEDIPLAMCEFHGKLLVGIGKCLRMFELGKRKLLRKCENKLFPCAINKIQINGERMYIGDMVESVHFARYKRQENCIVIFADDISPR